MIQHAALLLLALLYTATPVAGAPVRLGPGDVERWYRRVIEGRPDEHDVVVPARPDL